MKKAIFIIATISSVLFCGCCRRTPYCYDDVTTYAQRAYLEEEAMASCLEEQDPAPALLDLRDCDCTDGWQRQPYETVDEWLERIQQCMCMNRDTILNLEEEYHALQAREQGLATKIQSFISKNEHLRELRSQLNDEERQNSDFKGLSSGENPPFTIHLVQRGETLYSIAMQHYHSREMVDNMMRWNQGWIRHPDELIAGLGLVLFPADSKAVGQKVVANYLEELQGQEN